MPDTKTANALRRSGYLVGCIVVVVFFAVFFGALGTAVALGAIAVFYARGRWPGRRHET